MTRDNKDVPSARKQKKLAPFLAALVKILEEEDTDIISWSNEGNSFVIHSQERFEEEVLGKYFKHKKLASFLRQANMYYMRKFGDVGWLEFGHEDSLLHRDFPDRIWSIKRRPRDAAAAAAAAGQIVPAAESLPSSLVLTVVGELSDVVRTMADSLPQSSTMAALKRRLDVIASTCDKLSPRAAKRPRISGCEPSGAAGVACKAEDEDDGSWDEADEDESERSRQNAPRKVRRVCRRSTAAPASTVAASADEVTHYTLSALDDTPTPAVSTMVPSQPLTALPAAAFYETVSVADFDEFDGSAAFGGKPFPAAEGDFVVADDAGAAAVPLSPSSENTANGNEWLGDVENGSDALYYGKALPAGRNLEAMPPCAGGAAAIVSRDREGRVTLRTASMT